MPKLSARFSFTINAEYGINRELIDFLNSFETPSERRMFIISAIENAYIETVTGFEGKEKNIIIEGIEELREALSKMAISIEEIKKMEFVRPQNHFRMNETNQDLSEVESNLASIFEKGKT